MKNESARKILENASQETKQKVRDWADQQTKKAMDKQDTPQWHRSDVAHHPKYGLVEIFEVSLLLGFADVMPIDEKKWGAQWVLVKIEDLKKPLI